MRLAAFSVLGAGAIAAVVVGPGAKPHRVALVRGAFLAALAESGGSVVWENAASKSNPVSTLMQRDAATGRVRKLAVGTAPAFGVAATARWIVYARQSDSGVELVALRRDGSRRIVLARLLAAPLASRGDRVAWAEQDGDDQRIVVRQMATGREWVAWRRPRCERDRCYRIDAVTLADAGVAFDRGAIGTQPSQIVRRRYGDALPSVLDVPHDPQPDLAPSSTGALYYWLGHGWMRWDFGRGRPVRAAVPAREWVFGYEHGRTLLESGARCDPRVIVRRGATNVYVVPAPVSTPASPTQFGPLCRLLTAVVWHGRRLLVAWSVIPKVSLQAHTDVGLVGVVVAADTP